MVAPLQGLKVMELAYSLPAACCCCVLGDLGAEVVKVDRPQVGETEGPLARLARWRSLALDRNKRSVALDLKSQEGRQVISRLAQASDVLVEGFRPGVTERLGLDYESLRRANPRLIYCSITGFGQDGPYRDMEGHDINYVALSGTLSLQKRRGKPPPLPGGIADMGAALFAVIAILAASSTREKTGQGQFVDLSLFDSAVWWLSPHVPWYFQEVATWEEGLFSGNYAFYNIYETGDKEYLAVGAMEEKFWRNLCARLGLESWAEHQFTPGEQQAKLVSLFREAFLSRSRDEWLVLLEGEEVCVAPVREVHEVFDDPQVKHRGLLLELEHEVQGPVRNLATPIRLSGAPLRANSPPPVPGEHTREVLLELEYSEEDIDAMQKRGVIQGKWISG